MVLFRESCVLWVRLCDFIGLHTGFLQQGDDARTGTSNIEIDARFRMGTSQKHTSNDDPQGYMSLWSRNLVANSAGPCSEVVLASPSLRSVDVLD